MTLNQQKLDIIGKQLGIDQLEKQAIHVLEVVKQEHAPKVTMLQASDGYAIAAHERLQHFDKLVANGELLQAYRFGHGALKSAIESLSHLPGLMSEIVDDCHNCLCDTMERADSITNSIQDDIPAPLELTTPLIQKVHTITAPLNEIEIFVSSEAITHVEHAYDSAQIDTLTHELTEIERQAENRGLSLPKAADIPPLDPLPAFNGHTAGLGKASSISTPSL